MAASSSPDRKYDVFLSFRGEDTRGGFTDHLNRALTSKGISTFRDDNEIKEGNEISLHLSAAIEASRFAIVVVSENYASSRWCLVELVKIFECQDQLGMTVFPIFYKVDPSLVRNQRGSFGEALLKHEARFGKDELKVQKWRQVLTKIANLKAWLSQDWSYESEIIEKICEEIWKRIKRSLTTIMEEDQLIGITSKLNQISSLLIPNSESDNDVIFIGIHGMGGIGKTTIAMLLYEQIRDEFEACCFLSNIRETFETHNLPYLQSKLLTKMFSTNNNDIYDAQEGIALITKAISQKKLLLVLDDVDNLEQITGLIPMTSKKCCFGYGSRVIITTRNADLMSIFESKRMFKMGELEYKEALELLSLNAFMEKCPKECYLEHSKSIVKLVGGHPLALKVLGTYLRNKDLSVWDCVIQELQEGGNIIIHEQIFKCLKVSYDGLDEKEKVIFLDVACFFKGKRRNLVEEILDGCGLYAKRRVQLLIQKSLITLSHDDKLQVHDLLQEMSWRIVRQKPVQDRFWCHKDIKNVFQDTKAAIQSIMLKATNNIVEIPPILFSRMHQLRLLNFHNVRMKKKLEYCNIPSELRYLKWKGCPLEFLPFNSYEEYELIELHMCHSNLKQFWEGEKNMGKLKYVKLNHSKMLLKTPDFTQAPYLERLELEGCTSLVNIHPSIFVAKRLIFLSFKDCINLNKLSSHITIEVLQVLILSGCLKLKKLPEFTGNTSRLQQLHLDNTSITSLPSSITTLTSLTMLSLKNCKGLFHIPTTIKWLVSLSHFGRPSELENRKRKLDDVGCLEELNGRETRRRRIDGNNNDDSKNESGCSIIKRLLIWLCKTLGSNVFGVSLVFRLQSLTKLHLKDCKLKFIPEEIECLVSLRELNLSDNNFSRLPRSISQLRNLKRLIMNRCKLLQDYPVPPRGLRKIQLVDCFKLEMFTTSTKEGSYFMNLLNCYKLANNKELYKLIISWMQKASCQDGAFNILIPGNEIPNWFTKTNMGSSISVEWDQRPRNANLIRVALSVVCGPTDYGLISMSKFFIIAKVTGSKPYNNPDFVIQRLAVNAFYIPTMRNLDHVWCFVVPQSTNLTKLLKNYGKITFRFKFESYHFPSSISMKECGVRFISMEEEKGYLGKLKYIKLNHSKRLLKTPNFTQVPYLERLELEGCTSLVNIHPSIFVAKRLVFLSFKDCISLTKLPSHISIEVLQVLTLSGCLKLEKLPEFTGNTSRLQQLHLDNTSIASLPSSITTLTSLTMLSLKNCKRLFHIPTRIKWLVSLSHLSRPSELESRKRKLDDVGCLEELNARETGRKRDCNNKDDDKDKGGCNIIRRMLFWLFKILGSDNVCGISLVFRLHSITTLVLKDCNLKCIPEEIECLVSLRELNLSGNDFSRLSVSISRLYNLKRLKINECKMLEYYPSLPPGIEKLLTINCISLKTIRTMSKVEGSYFMNLLNCYKLANNKELHKLITSWMQKTFCQDGAFNIIIPGNEIPDWFTTTKMGSSISVEWDPNAPNANSTRFALCAVCSSTDALPISNSFLITANVVDKDPNQVFWKRLQMVNGFYVSEMRNLDHVWMFVIPRSESLTSIIKHCKEIEFEFRLIGRRRHSNITLKKCGVRMITMEEEKGAMKLHTFIKNKKLQLLKL